MTALTTARTTVALDPFNPGLPIPVAANVNIFKGAAITVIAGYASPAIASTAQVCAGRAEQDINNVGGAAGAKTVEVRGGCFKFNNSTAGDLIAQANFGQDCFLVDDNTVALTNGGGTRAKAGKIAGVDAGGVWVIMYLANYPQNPLVEKEIELGDVILAAGTPMAAFADNAGASAPGVHIANSKAWAIRFNNYATQTAVLGKFCLPLNIDLTQTVAIKIRCSKVGATAGDLTTFDVAVYPQTTGALHDAATSAGGTTSACTNPATKTVQEVMKALTLANLGVAGDPETFSLKPTDGTLGTDDMCVHAMKLVYTAL